ncbi:uncharacterized protein PFL1_06669 [Pseudozyma flocculosa PF-1]|uniref:Uncharacterized protein n=2 Tax=Pseudozyma flocculosa TaxID=84751 RepID=A0A5C3F7P5_9BASI|nr:uncharacterized protein PFL1_06669 [Pseudozyma flocculosa PF-1]EPQ25802.1 hypothetical protein PFL1_06669 [Pseudozyma flocculosa PF-1]SPO40498.1 uncharacterized protein PSFLO_05980 [Pseudozyma flocculosa]
MLRRTLTLLKQASGVASSSSSTSTTRALSTASVPKVSPPSSTYNEMLSTLTSHISPDSLPSLVARQKAPHKNLYQHLSTLPNNGVGFRVRQRRWMAKGLDIPAKQDLREHWLAETQQGKAIQEALPKKVPVGTQKESGHLCYWQVTGVRLKDGGRQGKAWGRLYWRGKLVTKGRPQEIRGGLKYCWDSAC